MAPITLVVNGRRHRVAVAPDTPLLWVLRDTLGLTGTKFGCGAGQCGACLALVNGEPANTCLVPVSEAAGARITTIEGLAAGAAHPVQRAWVAEGVPQCGYCQPGQMIAAAALLARNPDPSDADIDAAMPNLCTCGTYQRVRAAIHRAARAGGAT